MSDSANNSNSVMQEAFVEWQQLNLPKFAVFGTLFTSAVDTLLFPFELVKTRLQVQGQVRTRVFLAFVQKTQNHKKNSPIMFSLRPTKQN